MNDTERLLHRLAGERDIRNLIAKLGHLADDGDNDDYLDLWAPDSTYHEADVEHSGREPQRARLERHQAASVQGVGSDARHLNTTLWVEFDDDENARAQSYYLYIRDASTGSPRIASTGRYWDRFRYANGRWYFVERRKARAFN